VFKFRVSSGKSKWANFSHQPIQVPFELRGLIEAMDEVATSAAKPSAADRKAMANRLELPAMPAHLGPLIHPANHRRRD
jgi:hypothetical protein